MNTCQYMFIVSGLVIALYLDVTYSLTSLADVKCQIGPFMYGEGTFTDPQNSCSQCECFADGTVECKSTCTTPECGSNYHQINGCNCTVCSKICENPNEPCDNSGLRCQKWQYHYEPDSCCPECRCWYDGVKYKRGRFQLANGCEKFRCQANGDIVVEFRQPCPDVKLQCVDPKLVKAENGSCYYTCPNGKTCRQGPSVIKYGEFKRVGSKVCACVGPDWYPRAFCAQSMKVISKGGDYDKLMKRRCMADPRTFTAWKEILNAKY